MLHSVHVEAVVLKTYEHIHTEWIVFRLPESYAVRTLGMMYFKKPIWNLWCKPNKGEKYFLPPLRLQMLILSYQKVNILPNSDENILIDMITSFFRCEWGVSKISTRTVPQLAAKLHLLSWSDLSWLIFWMPIGSLVWSNWNKRKRLRLPPLTKTDFHFPLQ